MRADEIFHAAVEKPTPAERAAYLDGACGDDAGLREQVQGLLKSHEQAGSFLEGPLFALPATSDQMALTESPGTVIGPYKLLQPIGEGGMGTVYMAEQTQPVRRTVALKLIKAGMDSRQVLSRFGAERQALALMDHPSIAKVFDAGTTDSGRPYFVMELVKGIPITQFCDVRRLTTRERLELAIPVCQAVQHAHQKGIIHRDLKPSNVLIALYDGKPVPKVIDFGVAKATGPQLTDQTLYTEFGSVVGTLEYMSPEQAEPNQLDIDTRSDVYSLGVLLYELLTGSTPLDRKRLRQGAILEMLRVIREEESPRPSLRLSTTEELPSIAACRNIEPRKLSGLMRGELDWIVMKALEKDRNRRYETANGLAADLRRYLDDEPVQACPPSAMYRLRKFARRNKGPVLAAALILLALICGGIGTTLGMFRAEAARQDAVRAQRGEAERAAGERLAKQHALAAAEAEKKAKETAQARAAETNAVLDFVENKVFAAARPENQEGGMGYEVKLADAINAALPFVDSSFRDQPLTEARLRNTLGLSFSYLGRIEIAVEQYHAARKLYTKHRGPDDINTLRTMSNLARCYNLLGRHAEALNLDEQTLALRKAKLGPDHPDTLQSSNNLANNYADLGRHAEALKLREETLALQKAKLGPDHPDTLGSMNNLANSYSDLGRYAESLKLNEETLTLLKAKLGPHHPETLTSMNNLAIDYTELGRHADALKLHQETLSLRKAKLGPSHPDTLQSMNNLANTYKDLDRHADELKLHDETLTLLKAKLGPDHPLTLVSMRGVAEGLVALGRGAEAVPIIDECIRRSTGKAVHPRLIPGVIDLRLKHFAKAKDATACRATVEMWERLKRTDAESLYYAACFRAISTAVIKQDPKTTGADVAPLAKEEADQAMAWLKQAVAAGFRDVVLMKTEKDLDALRDRTDFQKLVAQLAAGQEKDKK